MRNTLLFLIAAISAFSPAAAQSEQSSQTSYTIVSRVREGKYFNRKVHKETIAGLPESLKALVAYYGVIYSTNCVSDSLGQRCELTEALGLGLQGSARQTEILLKWFRNDTLVSKLKRERNFRVAEQGSSSFNELLYLKLLVLRDTVRIDIQDLYWSQGRSERSKYSNTAVIIDGAISFIK